ncbi:histidine kinase [Enemella sp. A6]|uniref:sensor histidine kinase n=1 Tax=Enemella sp. A6 TaxID=3440152 RepID=UPI003EBDD4DF
MTQCASPPAGAAGSTPPAGHAPPWVIDALLGTAVALTLALIIATSEGGVRPADAVAYLFAAAFGALMLLRRRMPRALLVLSVLGVFAYYALDYPPIGVAIPVLAALFSAAEAGFTWWSVSTALIVFAVSMFFRVLDGAETIGFLIGYETVSNTALFATAIALGVSVRSRRLRAAQQAEIVRLTEAQLSREAELRLQGERERISRELHDTVGHTMSVISLHAAAATEALGRDDDAAGEALDHIRKASTRSLRELRTMVRILRSSSESYEMRRVQSLSEIQQLVDTAKGTGIDVTADISVVPSELSAPVDTAAYRVIQESITNVLRHADATNAQVTAHIDDGRLHVCIADNGRRSATDETRVGHGIAGMTERVRLLGGSLTTHSVTGEGFTVEATIPARLP